MTDSEWMAYKLKANKRILHDDEVDHAIEFWSRLVLVIGIFAFALWVYFQ